MSGIPLAFTFPFVLAALAGLPLLYFLLRITPPRPALVPFRRCDSFWASPKG